MEYGTCINVVKTRILGKEGIKSVWKYLQTKQDNKSCYVQGNFFGKSKLAEILENQIEENYDNCVGEFDGMCYASWRARAIYRTLEDMVKQDLITKSEYEFCQV